MFHSAKIGCYLVQYSQDWEDWQGSVCHFSKSVEMFSQIAHQDNKIFIYDWFVSEVRRLKIDVQFTQKDIDLQALYTALALAYLESLKK